MGTQFWQLHRLCEDRHLVAAPVQAAWTQQASVRHKGEFSTTLCTVAAEYRTRQANKPVLHCTTDCLSCNCIPSANITSPSSTHGRKRLRAGQPNSTPLATWVLKPSLGNPDLGAGLIPLCKTYFIVKAFSQDKVYSPRIFYLLI